MSVQVVAILTPADGKADRVSFSSSSLDQMR